jgi:hypothetical protein
LLVALVAVIGGEWAALLRPAAAVSADVFPQVTTPTTPEIATHEVSVLGAALVHRGSTSARRATALDAPLPMLARTSPTVAAPLPPQAPRPAEAASRPPPPKVTLPLII